MMKMNAIESVNKMDTRLVQIFGGRLRDWAGELQKCPHTIVAISRKAPRLIELMVSEGFLSESILSRVVAEQALPFLTQNNNAGFVVVDDVMTYGTTFDHIFKLTGQAQDRCGGDGRELAGIPFAVGQEANPKYRELVTKYFLNLKLDQIAPFVNNEMLAFRLLGKPYDIEHPMITWTGDFTDEVKLDVTLKHITNLLNGQIFNIDMLVPTATGNMQTRCWTLLLPTDSRRNFYSNSDFKKLRIYLNPNKDRLLVAAMCPLSLSKTDMYSFGEILPTPLNCLWNEVFAKVDAKAEGRMSIAGNRSLAMWANFLSATILLRDIKSTFLEAFEDIMLQPQMFGPRREDLQYLIGPELCLDAESSLAKFLESNDVDSTAVSHPVFDHVTDIINERVPSNYANNYTTKLSNRINKAFEINDVLQAIFYTQHTDIELISRKDSNNNDDDDGNRLEFGITYSRLRQTVLDKFPGAAEVEIHECLDKLIDDGGIVPRYLDMAVSGKSDIWTRTFRVGEGVIQKVAQTVRLLFEKLSMELGKFELPAIVFEKFCTLAICVANDNKALQPLQSIGISKSFHLYGARPALLLPGQKLEFLTEWAISQNILKRNKSSTFTEENGNYSLHQDVEGLYPPHECPWDDDVKDELEDLAALVAAIYKKYKSTALVALTSTASNQELQRALEAELQLWLYDRVASVSKGLAGLTLLAESIIESIPTEDKLKRVNDILSNTANFTAQVRVKIELAEDRNKIYRQIDELVNTDKYLKRSWRKLHTTLNGRIYSDSKSDLLRLEKIKSVLRIAHITTRILRELLNLAGFKDPRSKGLEESLNLLQALLDNRNEIDTETRALFSVINSKSDITTLITTVKSEPLDDFTKAFPLVRNLVLEIIARCERVLLIYGIDQQNEKSEVLPQPHYIMMWDIIGSTDKESRDIIESLIVKANKLIQSSFGDRIKGFDVDSKDDSNSFACKSFDDVLRAFNILNGVFNDYRFRAGCEVNLQGDLNYYPASESLGGRAFEYAARIMAFYKEVNANPNLWSDDLIPPEPVKTSYMVVSEFAKRYAQQENTWPKSAYIVDELKGTYKARINASLPTFLTVLQLAPG
jgi:hypothetical protein